MHFEDWERVRQWALVIGFAIICVLVYWFVLPHAP